MTLGINMGSNISQDDINRAKGMRNPSAFDAGDNISDSDSGFDSMFDDNSFSDFDDIFGSSNNSGSDPFGASSNGNNGGQVNGNGFDSLDSAFNNGTGIPTGFQPTYNNGNNGAGQIQAAKPDRFDKALDAYASGMSNLGEVIVELVKSIKNRTADDFGAYSSNLIKTGMIGLVIFIALCAVSALTSVKFLSIKAFGGMMILSCSLCAGTGMICLGTAAMRIAGATRDSEPDIKNLPDAGSDKPDDATDDYEDSLGDIMDDLFNDDPDFNEPLDDPNEDPFNLGGNAFEPEDEPVEFKPNTGHESGSLDKIKKVDSIRENKLLSRKVLVEELVEFLPLENPNFAETHEIDPNDQVFGVIETYCLKAMANMLKCEMEEVDSSVVELIETFYSYEVKLKRVKSIKNMTELASEIEIYARKDPRDTGVSVSIDIVGDYFKAVITKGERELVTMGDCFQLKEVKDFFMNEKVKLPMICGINELGNVLTYDAKLFDTMLIAGKPRSGKSWYVLSIILSLALFNTPEDVQFIIVDPKEANLFNQISLLPHVAGLHNDSQVLQIMDDIISNEAPRRKKLLADNRVDDIWGLRDKGIKVPILYLVIDEYITVRMNLGEQSKILDAKLQVMISQLPSLGIRVIFVPHRSIGIVDKTNRTMIQFTACVKSDIDEVNDTLGIKGWKRPLINPGDIALKTSATPDPMYVRGAALTKSDADNATLIETFAKAFYKMGVDLPDMSTLQIAANRDESLIREKLEADNRVQYNAEHIFDDDIDTSW